jgi:hypothetical protein
MSKRKSSTCALATPVLKKQAATLMKLTHYRQPTTTFIKKNPELEQELMFISEIIALFRKLDAEQILNHKHRFFNMHNLENIVLNTGHDLLFEALRHIKNGKQISNFLRLCTELNWSQEFWTTLDRKVIWKNENGLSFDSKVKLQSDHIGRLEQVQIEGNFQPVVLIFELLNCLCKLCKLSNKHADGVQRIINFFVSKGFTFNKYQHPLKYEMHVLGHQVLPHLYESNLRAYINIDWDQQLSAEQKQLLAHSVNTYIDNPSEYKISLQIIASLGFVTPIDPILNARKTWKVPVYLEVYKHIYNYNCVDNQGNSVAHKMLRRCLPINAMSSRMFWEYMSEVYAYLKNSQQIDMTLKNHEQLTAFDYLFDVIDEMMRCKFTNQLINTSTGVFNTFPGSSTAPDIAFRLWYEIIGLCQFTITPATVKLTEQTMRTVFFPIIEQCVFYTLVKPKALVNLSRMMTYTVSMAIRCIKFEAPIATYSNHVLPLTTYDLSLYSAYHSLSSLGDVHREIRRLLQKLYVFFKTPDKSELIRRLNFGEYMTLRAFCAETKKAQPGSVVSQPPRQHDLSVEFNPDIDLKFINPCLSLVNFEYSNWCRINLCNSFFLLQGLMLGVELKRLGNWCSLQDSISYFVHMRDKHPEKILTDQQKVAEDAHRKHINFFTPKQTKTFKYKVVNCKDLFDKILSFLF